MTSYRRQFHAWTQDTANGLVTGFGDFLTADVNFTRVGAAVGFAAPAVALLAGSTIDTITSDLYATLNVYAGLVAPVATTWMGYRAGRMADNLFDCSVLPVSESPIPEPPAFRWRADDPDCKGVLDYFLTGYPRHKSERYADLDRLLKTRGSFGILSDRRNGTTTLMKDFANRHGGFYVDGQGEVDSFEALEACIGSGNNPVLLDETVALFRKLGGYEHCADYLQRLSSTRQVGLRLHPEQVVYKDDLARRGFEIIEWGNIPYKDFRALVTAQFDRINFPFPERWIQYAYDLPVFGLSLRFVGHVFECMLEQQNLMLPEDTVFTEFSYRSQYALRSVRGVPSRFKVRDN